MSSRLKKILLLLLAAVLLVGASQLQLSLNVDREKLGLTRVEPLKNAPPVLAFTTVALGGFRGLISNALWIRATDLQDDDKFFEMAQLADWITKLEPNFVQVWLVQAWNMAYNISVKFKDYPDRWRWVKRGFELLRDDGLRYNPNEILMYRELAWIFQHKLGQNLDDASMYYKREWAKEMTEVLGKKPNLDELIHPKTPEQQRRAAILRDKYKMDPEFMKEVDQEHGPLEWRLPESQAIYWAAKGLKAAKENPTKVTQDDLITLRRVIYQSLQMSFKRGRLVTNPFTDEIDFGPNLEIIGKASGAYEQEAAEDEKMHDHILTAHRNFLRDAVFYLYEQNRTNEANSWFQYLCKQYPNKPLLDGKPNSLPGKLDLDEFAVARVQEALGDTMSHDDAQAGVEGLLIRSYTCLVLDEDERAYFYKRMAQQVWKSYMSSLPKERMDALGLRPFEEIDREVLRRLLDPEHGLKPAPRLALRSKLRLPAETKPPEAVNPAPEKTTAKQP
jgi:hypothetical protein